MLNSHILCLFFVYYFFLYFYFFSFFSPPPPFFFLSLTFFYVTNKNFQPPSFFYMATDPLQKILSKSTHSNHTRFNIPLKHSQFFREPKGVDLDFFGMTFTQRITCFLTFLLLGVFSFSYSLFNILTAVFNPARFALPYAFSNFLFFTMFGFILGFKSYFMTCFGGKKKKYTSLFLTCTILTIYVALKFRSYMLNLVFTVAQVTSFIVFIVSFFPGGTSGMSGMMSMITKR